MFRSKWFTASTNSVYSPLNLFTRRTLRNLPNGIPDYFSEIANIFKWNESIQ